MKLVHKFGGSELLGASVSLSKESLSRSVVSDSATPWTLACQAPLSMGFSRQEHWNRLPFPPPGDLPDPWIGSGSPVSPALQADSFLSGSLCQRNETNNSSFTRMSVSAVCRAHRNVQQLTIIAITVPLMTMAVELRGSLPITLQSRAQKAGPGQGLLLVTIPEDSLSKITWESGPARNMQGLLPNSYPKMTKDYLFLAFPIMLYTV